MRETTGVVPLVAESSSFPAGELFPRAEAFGVPSVLHFAQWGRYHVRLDEHDITDDKNAVDDQRTATLDVGVP